MTVLLTLSQGTVEANVVRVSKRAENEHFRPVFVGATLQTLTPQGFQTAQLC